MTHGFPPNRVEGCVDKAKVVNNQDRSVKVSVNVSVVLYISMSAYISVSLSVLV